MRFDRQIRPEGLSWTARKEAAYLNRNDLLAKKIAKDYPLFQDEFAPRETLDVDSEKRRRERLQLAADQRLRDLWARHWRAARAEYFACSSDVRAQIFAAWEKWAGPAKAGYFIYVVRTYSGLGAELRSKFDSERKEMEARIWKKAKEQSSFSI